MQEVDFASLTAQETAPVPTSSECGADMELYMHLCRRVLALGIKRWGGDAPGRLGPRVLDPDEPRDRAMIEGMFAPQPEADGEADAGLQTPAQGALPLAPQSLTTGSATGAPQPMEVGATTWSDLAPFRVCNGLDIFVVPNFAQTQLGVDPAELQQKLETYPTRGAADDIQPDVVQWVGGDNKALRYRGNTIPRTKIWLQRLPKEAGYLRYGYTGWQWNVLPATVGVEQCPEVLPLADRYDKWVTALGLPSANHYIATRYSDGKDCIGWHSDKDKDIAPGSLITVVKMGAHGRCFEMCLPGEEESPFFSKVLAPGTAVIMTLEANLATKHRVPVASDAGPSGSIVLRTITKVVSHTALAKELSKRQCDDAVAPAGGSATGAPRPMEVEAPAGTVAEAPPLLVPPSALHGLGLDGLVSQLKGVFEHAAPLDEAMVGRVLDGLEGLRLSGKALEDAGAPPTAHVPGMPPLPCHQPSPSHGPAQARANWSTGCARSQECLRRSTRAPKSCTASGRRTGMRSSETICTRGVRVVRVR